MATLDNLRRIRQIQAAFASAIHEAESECVLRQDLACKTCSILRAASEEFEASNHGSNLLSDVFTRNLFADPKRQSPADKEMVVRLLLFLAKEGNRQWSMVSGMLDVPVETVLNTFKRSGVEPTVAFEIFLRHFHKEIARSDWRALAT